LPAALGIGCLVLVVSPALMAISQGMLNSAVRNLQAGNCGEASHDALDAIHDQGHVQFLRLDILWLDRRLVGGRGEHPA